MRKSTIAMLLATVPTSLRWNQSSHADIDVMTGVNGPSCVGAWSGPPETGGVDYLMDNGAANKYANATNSAGRASLTVSTTLQTANLLVKALARSTAIGESSSDSMFMFASEIVVGSSAMKVSWMSSAFGLNANCTVNYWWTRTLREGWGADVEPPLRQSGTAGISGTGLFADGGTSADSQHPVGSVMLEMSVFPSRDSQAAAPGDFDNDGKIDAFDITFLQDAMRAPYTAMYDLNSDEAIDGADLSVLLGSISTVRGDANLDCRVDIADSSILGTNWNEATLWRAGDFDRDGTTNTPDYAAMAANWGFDGSAMRLHQVPESGALATWLLAQFAMARRRVI